MIEYLTPKALIGSVVYSVIGIMLVAIFFVIIDKITPYDLWQELVEKQNMALAIVVGAMSLGISIIVAAAVIG